ncbi:CPBP family intramembrane glutamic endopeptidase [Yoonia maritima]|uniref:CPBP family intramembrane glutamic endopeptidase n=1 Tax=Yoonia maritima TaxID=1435347 RepID=UPI000D0EF8CF|nr:CPBP family intramembrane glutamic endopeptidase [Yoonia maritima]
MTNLGRAVLATLIYIGIVGVATVFVFRIFTTPLDTVSVMWRTLSLQIILLLSCYLYVRRYTDWYTIGFRRLNWGALVWLLPAVALVFAMGFVVINAATKGNGVSLPISTVGLLVVVPFLVGLTEEIMFRGILLRGALARLPVFQAMLLSALLFSLMHCVNVFTGQPALATLQHTAFAFLVGVFLAPIALKLGNLWPLIMWHTAWDFMIYSSQMLGVVHHYALIGIMIQTLVSIWLWVELIGANR